MSANQKTPARPLSITVKKGEEISGLTHGQIYEAMNQGLFASMKVMGRRLIDYESFENFLLTCADQRPPSAFANDPRQADPRLPPEYLARRRARRAEWEARRAEHKAAPEAADDKKRGRPRKTQQTEAEAERAGAQP